jgi:hypothetical protein
MAASVVLVGDAELEGLELPALPALEPPLLEPQAATPRMSVAAATVVNARRAFMMVLLVSVGIMLWLLRFKRP